MHRFGVMLLATACAAGRSDFGRDGEAASDAATPDARAPIRRDLGIVYPDAVNHGGCGDVGPCYDVYAHSDHVLYRIDLAGRTLVTVGRFNAPIVPIGMGRTAEDTITDLAVAPDNTIYVISRTTLYTASASDGHVTAVGPITACGQFGVALTFTPDGSLYTGDFHGAFCRIDLASSPPAVRPVATLSGGMALAGDLVAVADGTMYGTAYLLSDPANRGTQLDNVLVRIDPATGAVTRIGATGYPKLFGVAYQLGEVFGFTHDGSGHVVTINPMTGAGTMYGTFTESGHGISFAGAGVNAMVPATIM